MYVAFFQSDYLEFLGLKQAWRAVPALVGEPKRRTTGELFGTHRLVVTGVYAWVRHPMLVGGLGFLLTSGPSLNNLIYTGMYTTYMLIGGYYEEKRLVRIFGDDYRRYRAQVGAFFPRRRRVGVSVTPPDVGATFRVVLRPAGLLGGAARAGTNGGRHSLRARLASAVRNVKADLVFLPRNTGTGTSGRATANDT